MITKENKIQKSCCFYASDYHLEMIILPYINKKIDEKAQVTIITEKNLSKTIETVVSKINLPEQRKQEILEIDWKNNKNNQIGELINTKKEVAIFVIGSKKYIEKTNKEIDNINKIENINIVNSYNFQEVKNNMVEIVDKHKKVINSSSN